jgi:peptidoglycan/xylan/chitin deacetylase (PgdA/CDA1 family)
VLSSLSREEILEELAASKAALEERLGRPVNLFAYPFGALEHFDGITERLVEDSGYKAAFTTLRGINEAGGNPWALKRVGIQDDPPALFAFKLSRLQN